MNRDTVERAVSELLYWSRDDIIPRDLQGLCEQLAVLLPDILARAEQAERERDEARGVAKQMRDYLQAEENHNASYAGDEPRDVAASNPFPWEAHP